MEIHVHFFWKLKQEGVMKGVELLEDNPVLVSRFIRCCYTTTYDDGAYTLDTTSNRICIFLSRLNFNAEMYSMCERVAMHGIKKVVEKKFQNLLSTPLSSKLNIKHDRILDVIPIVYNTTPEGHRGLRDALISYLAEPWAVFTRLPRFKSAMVNTPDFGLDLFIAKCEEECKGCKEREE